MRTDLSLPARFCSPPPFAVGDRRKPTAAQRAGTRYEEKALAYLGRWATANGYTPVPKQWVEYRDISGRVQFAEIDFHALSPSDDNLLLVEVKLRHTRDAFTQLRRYKGLLQEIYPDRTICPIEVCCFFDCAEFATHLLSELRPHNLPHAAFIWEPPIVPGVN